MAGVGWWGSRRPSAEPPRRPRARALARRPRRRAGRDDAVRAAGRALAALAAREAAEHLREVERRVRVEPRRRLVEQQHGHVAAAGELARDRHAPLLARRELPHERVSRVRQLEPREQRADVAAHAGRARRRERAPPRRARGAPSAAARRRGSRAPRASSTSVCITYACARALARGRRRAVEEHAPAPSDGLAPCEQVEQRRLARPDTPITPTSSPGRATRCTPRSRAAPPRGAPRLREAYAASDARPRPAPRRRAGAGALGAASPPRPAGAAPAPGATRAAWCSARASTTTPRVSSGAAPLPGALGARAARAAALAAVAVAVGGQARVVGRSRRPRRRRRARRRRRRRRRAAGPRSRARRRARRPRAAAAAAPPRPARRRRRCAPSALDVGLAAGA